MVSHNQPVTLLRVVSGWEIHAQKNSVLIEQQERVALLERVVNGMQAQEGAIRPSKRDGQQVRLVPPRTLRGEATQLYFLWIVPYPFGVRDGFISN